MQYGAGVVVKAAKRIPLLGIVGLLFATAFCVVAQPVYAQNSKLQTIVNSGTLHPALSLTNLTSPVSVTTMPLEVQGVIDSLTQIQVFIDGAFAVTVPLDEGATTFSTNLIVPVGTHGVSFLGISPFADITPTATLTVTYDPIITPPVEQTVEQGGGVQVDRKGGLIINKDGGATSTTGAATVDNTHTSLPTWFYSGLVALDLASPGDPTGQETAKMVQRFSLATSGVVLLTFTQPVLGLYRFVRGTRLGIPSVGMPKFMTAQPVLFLRVIGILLTTSAFLL